MTSLMRVQPDRPKFGLLSSVGMARPDDSSAAWQSGLGGARDERRLVRYTRHSDREQRGSECTPMSNHDWLG
jgi:hypothetical protein